jgi:EmrB/QacA subfamily drug resistance transporter
VAKADPVDPQIYKLAGVLLVGVLAVVFDTTIVNVALDRLAAELGAPISVIQWVTTGYLLALAMAVPVTGWLLDRFGGKSVWIAALAIFLLGSIASSLAWDAPSLIAARILQGIGGGLMLPVMQTILIQAAGPRSLGRITAVVALPALLGPILGPVLGGFIVDAISWRWIFWINVPFCLAGIALALWLMPAIPPTRRLRFDALGFILLSPGIAALLYGLSRVALDGGFGAPDVIVPLAVGVVLVAAFTLRAVTMAGSPLVDVKLLRVPSLSAATLQLFLSGFVLYGAMLLIPLYAQQVLGYGTFAAGLLLAPQGVGALLSRPLAGRLSDSIGARWIVVVGFVLVIAGTLPFAGLGFDVADPWLLSAALVVRGLGLGAVTIPVMAAAYVDLDKPQVPHASIITRTAQQVGGSFGTAILAVILETGAAGQSGPAMAPAFSQSFVWTIGFTAVALAAAFWLPARREPVPATA